MAARRKLTVAVTGATGTVGRGLLPHLESDPRVERVVALALRPWSPSEAGFQKVEYLQVDLRDRDGLERAFAGADVVVHLAFALYGLRPGSTLTDVNVAGTRNALAAAATAGARRFVYTSSGAVYGFDRDRPVRVDEDAPIDPARRHFYSRHKADLERLLLSDLERLPDLEWVILRPCAVVGPHALAGARRAFPPAVRRVLSRFHAIATSAVTPAVPAPPVPLQFVHESDLGRAIHSACTSPVKHGIYNVAGDGLVDGDEVPRLLGLRRLPLPGGLGRALVGAASRLPYVPPAIGWTQLLTHPLELDTSRVRRELRWKPEFDSRAALAATRRAVEA